MDDVRAVMDAVGSERAVLCGVSEGGPMCSLFAATYPEKTIALVMIATYAKRIWDPDYPWAPLPEEREQFFAEIQQHWGGAVGIEERAPSVADDPRFREWWASYLRMGASPGAALTLTQMNAEIDIRQVLPTIRVPTLVLHRAGDRLLKVEEGRYVAERIPGAKFIELPGTDHLPFVGDQDAILEEIEEFLTGVRNAPAHDQVLATVLVTQLVDAPARVAAFGEVRWRDLLERHKEHRDRAQG
jgi:pimeloyl-ACP methyl ester carboxylesterase